MPLTRREFAASAATAVAITARAADPSPAGLGLLLYSYGIRARAEKGFADPLAFAEFGRPRGAAGVQASLGTRDADAAAQLRRRCGDLGVYLEGIVRCPADERDVGRFDAEMRTAAACGAEVVRTVMLGGRRYETFRAADDFPRFARQAERSLTLAEPVARRHRVKLAVENHKDYRADEMAALMKRVSSEYLGVCVDTGNNIALLDEPLETIKVLAPWVLTVHLKDMGVEESRDGFLLAEVPLGRGVLDLKEVVGVLRKANPRVRFNLEMITRDPLSIPCLAESYWPTLGGVPGRDLARALAWVRRSARKEPLPRVTKLPLAEQLAAEDRHVQESFEFAARTKLLAAG